MWYLLHETSIAWMQIMEPFIQNQNQFSSGLLYMPSLSEDPSSALHMMCGYYIFRLHSQGSADAEDAQQQSEGFVPLLGYAASFLIARLVEFIHFVICLVLRIQSARWTAFQRFVQRVQHSVGASRAAAPGEDYGHEGPVKTRPHFTIA